MTNLEKSWLKKQILYIMVVLGINGGFRQGYSDVSACLVVNGEVIAAIEEERLNRIKFSPGRLPYLSVLEVLNIGKLAFEDVDLISFHGSTWGEEIQPRLEAYFTMHFGSCPNLIRYHHHDCHAASTFYASKFDEALVITLDNSGDGVSLRINVCNSEGFTLLKEFERPNSLGIFYSLITQYCGFTKDSDEFKLMGLASYGDKNKFDFSWLIDYKESELTFNQDYLIVIPPKSPSPHKNEMLFNAAFIKKMLYPRRLQTGDFTQYYKDIAASAQAHLESLVLKISEQYIKETGLKKLCLAGGTALNCVMNKGLMNADFVDQIFIQPAAGDAGISLGAAWLASMKHGVTPKPTSNTYLGSSFSNQEIKNVLDIAKVNYRFEENPEIEAAKWINDNKVIAWFQGKMEFGPRSLGSRSILANPTHPEIQQKVNDKIKFRESFRPFCPSVLEEDASLYFSGKQLVSPYMNITYDVNDFGRENIPGVVHVDQTARIQTVNKNQNELYYKLLLTLKELNGHGVVLNTSFNLSHEPIVSSPRDALASFFASGIDVLIMGNYVIVK